MKKILSFIFQFLLITCFSFVFSQQVFAQEYLGPCDSLSTQWSNFRLSNTPNAIPENSNSTYNISFIGVPNGQYAAKCYTEDCGLFGASCPGYRSSQSLGTLSSTNNNTASLSFSNSACWTEPSRDHIIALVVDSAGNYCKAADIDVAPIGDTITCDLSTFEFYTSGTNNIGGGETLAQGCFEAGDTVYFRGQILSGGVPAPGNTSGYLSWGRYTSSSGNNYQYSDNYLTNGDGYFNLTIDTGNPEYNFQVGESLVVRVGNWCTYQSNFTLFDTCTEDDRQQPPLEGEGQQEGEFNAFSLCEQVSDPTANAACENCLASTNGNGIWTAVGCFSGEPAQIIGSLIRLGLNIGGGIALIMILVAGFMFSTSQGDPNKVKEAKELMISAVIGLFFIIFSVTILQFIGSSLLKIPGFGDQ